MLLSEKMRPKSFNEVLGNEHVVNILRNLVKTGDIPNLLFYGPPGTGKTTLAYIVSHHLLKENFSNNFLETNASVDRGIDVIRNRIKDFAASSPMGTKIRILLLDEVDLLSFDAFHALRRTMEIFPQCRFILTANHIHKVIDPIRSRCLNLPFKKIESKELKKLIKTIPVEFENEETIDLLIKVSENDLRYLINNLQALSSLGKRITQRDLSELFNLPLSSQIDQLISERNFTVLKEKIQEILYNQNVSPKLIIREVLSRIRNPAQVQKLSEVDFRISMNGLPELHLLDLFLKLRRS